MINYVYQGNKITLNWTVKKGAGLALEDFSRAATHLFLIHGRYRFVVPCTVGPYPTDGSEVTVPTGTVHAEITEELPEGTYSAEILWVKNFDSFAGSRNLQRTRVDNLFCVTVNESEATSDQAPAVITATTVAHAYGYDGLSAYEGAVFRGYVGTEEDFYKSIPKYEVVISTDDDIEFPDDGVWRFVKASASATSYTAMYLGSMQVSFASIPSAQLSFLEQIYNSGVTTSLLVDEAVTTAKIDDGAVTADKIDSGAVTYGKLGDDVQAKLANIGYVEFNGVTYDDITVTQQGYTGTGDILFSTKAGIFVKRQMGVPIKYYSAWPDNTKWQDPNNSYKPYTDKIYVCGDKLYVYNGTDLIETGLSMTRVVSQSASVTFYGSSYPIGGESYYTTGSVLIPVKKGQIIEVEGTSTIKYAVLNGTSSVYASGYGKVSYTPASNINVTIGNTSSTSAPAVVTIYDTLASLQARIIALEG